MEPCNYFIQCLFTEISQGRRSFRGFQNILQDMNVLVRNLSTVQIDFYVLETVRVILKLDLS